MSKAPKNNKVNTFVEDFDFKKALLSYLKYWKWFVLSVIITSTIAFFKVRYATPIYSAYSKIMVMPDEGASNPAETILKDLGQISGSGEIQIEDEIQLLQSRTLMTGVIKKLNLNIKHFAKGQFHDTQFFPNEESPIKLSFIASDSIIHKAKFTFSILVTSNTAFKYFFEDDEEGINKSFGENIPTIIGDIVLTPKAKNIKSLIGQTIYVKITPVDIVAEYYKKAILIKPVSEFSKVLNLSLKDASPRRAKTILNTLVDEYIQTSVDEKNLKSTYATDFINKRINYINSELAKVDSQIENFKKGNKLTNITSEADIYLTTNAQTEQELAQSRTEYNMVNFMKKLVVDDSFDRIPSNVGLADGGINSMAQKYNELLDERDRLLKSSNEKNPIIVNLNQQIKNVKNNLRQSLNNSGKTIGLKINSLENQAAKINSKIYAVPGQVKQSRDIQREQGVKESLYLYLLQKREEATISQISKQPNAKVIDRAHSNYIPVAPNIIIIYFTWFIVGLCIPFGIIYVKNVLDNKIHNKEDLEKEIKNITVLGEIPRISGSNKKLVERNDRSILSESFRIVRTNLDYVRRRDVKKPNSNVIFTTSTINGEGKSFVSLNMALTFANTGKKVLLIGADVRNPQTHTILDAQKSEIAKIGLTEYLSDDSISLNNVIKSHEVNNIKLDLLISGKVPPNPAELLMSDRLKELFEKVSKDYDYVIVDTAPSMLVTDTLLFSQYAGYTIYVTRADYTEKKVLNFAKELYADDKLNGMMLVVNDVNQSNFGYGAKYGYYGAPEKKGFFRRFRKKSS
ncbi:polysaccharide biosynthesis tyrosine autokinase [Algibacter sp. 2305UL17-15]|uniref:GumC family protein n=1 Tax=Algibacter sp. 2305UL17-15 TaxID=3231268 RepID=UPI00345B377D